MKAGSFFPGSHYSSLYAMAGDDCSLFYNLETLTPKQREDHVSNQELTAMLQVGLACIGHSADHLALYEEYQQPGWREALQRYHGFFSRMVDDQVPMAHFSYHPREGYYESVAALIAAEPGLTDVANLYMGSGSNFPVHQDPSLLEINRKVNAKQHFAEHAPAFGIPFPDTLVTTRGELESAPVADFVSRHGEVMIKLEGLAGARNVSAADSLDFCRNYVAQYDNDMIIVLQEKLDLDYYTEMTVDLVVKPDDIRVSNVRKILFAEGLWVGNLIGESVSLNAEQQAMMIRVGEYARSHGYVTEEGSNCGVDFFVGRDGSVIVTEINARWTGGLFPAEVLRQVGVTGRDAVPFFDVAPVSRREDYIDFIERHLYDRTPGADNDPFAMLPIGFGCFPVAMEGEDCFYTWQIVVGDLTAFKEVKAKELGPGVMPTADIINL